MAWKCGVKIEILTGTNSKCERFSNRHVVMKRRGRERRRRGEEWLAMCSRYYFYEFEKETRVEEESWSGKTASEVGPPQIEREIQPFVCISLSWANGFFVEVR